MATTPYLITARAQTGEAIKMILVSGIRRTRTALAQLTYDEPDASTIVLTRDTDGAVMQIWKRNNYTGEWFQRKVA